VSTDKTGTPDPKTQVKQTEQAAASVGKDQPDKQAPAEEVPLSEFDQNLPDTYGDDLKRVPEADTIESAAEVEHKAEVEAKAKS
jgi:hypothetical protein